MCTLLLSLEPDADWPVLIAANRDEMRSREFSSLWSSAMADDFVAANPKVIEELAGQLLDGPTPRRMLLQQLRAMSGWGHAERLQRIEAPTIVLHGSRDTFIPPENGREISALIPGSVLVELEGVGHLVPHEAPGAIGAALAELSKTTASTGSADPGRDGGGVARGAGIKAQPST